MQGAIFREQQIFGEVPPWDSISAYNSVDVEAKKSVLDVKFCPFEIWK